ncbi:chemotaxis protein CheD [Desulfitispora alkaliphila]|uniref:chemotaxis protein CheD n=1 Tax=Desulfitispora alkaliphila TaxID=622674 RepID=UPI003D1AB15A
MVQVHKVGMADLKVAKKPDELMTSGLGSCIGICLYDKVTGVSGLAHIMLPSSKGVKNADNKAKFADTAVDVLISEMVRIGAKSNRLTAKIAGGSQMFSFKGSSDVMKIGLRNAEAAKEAIAKARIPLLAEDCGGNHGRTIVFKTETGELYIRTIKQGEKVI